MITPSYAPTATERVLPRLALDFTTAALDPRVTVTRALNTATRINANGDVAIVNADLPRFDYDPLTGVCKGLLIEESRQNIQLQSEDFATTWSATGINVSTNSVVAPDGNQTADTLTASATPGNIVYLQSVGNGTTYTFSLFVKKLTSDTVQINFANVGAGPVFTFSTESFSTVASWTTSVQKLKNGWYRIAATRASNTTFAGMQIRIANSGEAIYAWGAQMEAGAFATSYIPTTTTSLTRNLDVVTMTGTNFSDWFNPSQGTFVVGLQKISPSSQAIYGFDVVGAASTYSMRVRLGTDARMQSVDNSVVQVDEQLAGSVPTTPAKYAMAYKLNDYAGAADGAAVVTDTSATVPALSSLNIGSTIVRNLYMRTIYYYPQRLINNEVQAFSK